MIRLSEFRLSSSARALCVRLPACSISVRTNLSSDPPRSFFLISSGTIQILPSSIDSDKTFVNPCRRSRDHSLPAIRVSVTTSVTSSSPFLLSCSSQFTDPVFFQSLFV
ncbi:hypothetical protein PCANC_18903 [Puccinia coronata f. sp. avenae]|uniref:Uncharacterized protein n=1 Tax=Puccinia coronata f. sp. avenae TaxID=200324 RepID=A0A2N5SNH0_9BASI|nr:hypothetical protein PCANC_18903 [Puccinia coronata f. sp. avenae]